MSGFADEIWEQPDALHRTLNTIADDLEAVALYAASLRRGDLGRVVMTAMGSSLTACYPALIHLNGCGVTALMIDAAELLYSFPALLDARTLLVAASQSGASVEVRRVVEELGRPGALIGVTNTPDSPLDRAADATVTTRAGDEVTVSSKTYTTTLAVMDLLAHALTGDTVTPRIHDLRHLADAMAERLAAWDRCAAEMVGWMAGVRFIEYLGRGPSYASAMTGALITKECAKFPTEGLSAGQFRHGPMEVTSPELGVILFAGPERTRSLSYSLARELASHGARVALIGGEAQPGVLHVPLPAADEAILPLAEIVPVQFFAAHLAASRGLEVGKFTFGGKITTTE